jgi:hypothetical protein
MSTAPLVFRNKAHQRAYEDGIRAAQDGKHRFAPYECANRTSSYFRKAWLAGYDGAIDRDRISGEHA